MIKKAKFRIPRKVKKKLWGIYLYPRDHKGNSLMGFPKENQEDYIAFKQGELRSFLDKEMKEKKEKTKLLYTRLRQEIYVTDQELKDIIGDSIGQDYRESFFRILSRAKVDELAKVAYFEFVNSYRLSKEGEVDRTSHVMPMCYDYAISLLKKSNDIKRRKKGKRVRKFGKMSIQK